MAARVSSDVFAATLLGLLPSPAPRLDAAACFFAEDPDCAEAVAGLRRALDAARALLWLDVLEELPPAPLLESLDG